jgi:beta-phosphoglucomutase
LIRAAIFDMDGVICHTNPYHVKAFDVFFHHRGIFPSRESYHEHMYGKSNRYIFSHFLEYEVSDAELKILEEEKEGLFRKIYAEHVEPIPGLLEFFDWLRETGIPIGVATSAPRANLDLIAGKLRLDRWASSFMSSEDVIAHKPNPEVYLSSAKRLAVLPAACLVFEDSFSGITAGRRAGMNVCGVLTSHTKEELPACDYYITDYENSGLKTFVQDSLK